MKAFSLLAAIATAAALTVPAFAKPEDALGRWATPTRHGVVEITPCGGAICGRLVDSEALHTNPDLRDIRNKSVPDRNRPLKGLLMLSGFKRAVNGWDGGAVYNPEDGGTYTGTITVTGPDTIKLKGCIVWPLCKTQEWRRIR